MIRSLPLALALLTLAAGPLPAEDAREAVIRSIEEGDRVSYAGVQTTVITMAGKTRRTVQVVKRRGAQKLRIEYLAPPRLKGEVVVDNGEQFRRYIPSLKLVEEGPSRLQRGRQRRQHRLRALSRGRIAVTLLGEQTLLGRGVTVVTVAPAKSDGPTRTLWLDRATGVALRIVEKGRGGRTSVTSFQRIEFNPVLGDAEFQLPIPAGVKVVPARLGRPLSLRRAEQIARRFWGGLPTPGSLPAGYTLTSAHQLSVQGRPAIALRYTRGRDDLTLFVSGADGRPFSAPVQPRLNVVQRPVGDVLVTLVGSLPTAELERVAASVRSGE